MSSFILKRLSSFGYLSIKELINSIGSEPSAYFLVNYLRLKVEASY